MHQRSPFGRDFLGDWTKWPEIAEIDGPSKTTRYFQIVGDKTPRGLTSVRMKRRSKPYERGLLRCERGPCARISYRFSYGFLSGCGTTRHFLNDRFAPEAAVPHDRRLVGALGQRRP
jgi:hypothetical protein